MTEKKLKPIGTAMALLEKVQTQKDGGFRITLDLPDTEIELIQSLLALKSSPSEDPLLYVSFVKGEAHS